MKVSPKNGFVCIEIKKHSDERAAEIKKRTGLELVKPEFEGLPNKGVVYMLSDEYEGPLKEGMTVAYKEDNPKGYMVDGKHVLFTKLENVMAVITE